MTTKHLRFSKNVYYLEHCIKDVPNLRSIDPCYTQSRTTIKLHHVAICYYQSLFALKPGTKVPVIRKIVQSDILSFKFKTTIVKLFVPSTLLHTTSVHDQIMELLRLSCFERVIILIIKKKKSIGELELPEVAKPAKSFEARAQQSPYKTLSKER